MKLRKVTLTNFRSIQKASVDLNDVTALVGENNSGKSALLRALNLFFNYADEELALLAGKHQYTQSSQPRIELTFNDLPNDNELSVHANGANLILRLTYNNATKRRLLQVKPNREYQNIDIAFIDKIKKHINFVFVPPNRDPSKIMWAEETLLKELVEAFLDQATTNRDTYSPKFAEAANFLQRNALSKIAKKTKEFYSLQHNFEYEIKFKNALTFKDFLNGIQFLVNEKDNSYDLSDCGTGIQSLTIIALHRLLSNLRHKKVILGLEEPETNLHPQAQRELIHSIKSATGRDGLSQIICTTHSPVIIDQIKHEQVILFRKVSDERRGFRTDVSFIPSDFFDKNDLEDFKYYQFHQYRNSDFFYAKYVIIVESKNETEVLKLLAQKDGYDLDLYGISILNLEGVTNLKYPLHLLKELNIPSLVIVDKDYFVPYLNDELATSRDVTGFPKYRYAYKADNLIDELITNARDRANLLKMLKDNFSRALDTMEKHNILSMRYSLEIDLVSSDKGAELYYDKLEVPAAKRNKHELLVNRKRQIKKIENILHVVNSLPNKNLPNSYKRIKKVLAGIVREIENR